MTITQATYVEENHNVQCLNKCKTTGFCTHGIVYLASVIGGNGLEDGWGFSCLEDLLYYLSHGTDHHDSIKKLMPPGIPPGADDESSFFRTQVQDHWIKNGYLGFAILAVVSAEERACSHLDDEEEIPVQWLYADTFPEVFELAVKWANQERLNLRRQND
jgi:hypothetical protein